MSYEMSDVAKGSMTHQNGLMHPHGPFETTSRRHWAAVVSLSTAIGIQLWCHCLSAGNRNPDATANSANNVRDAKPALIDGKSSYARSFRDVVLPFERKYCVECHGRVEQNGGVNFEAVGDFANVVRDRKSWEKIQKMLSTGEMPPADHEPRPAANEVASVLHWINRAVFDVDCSKRADPGHVTVRRLNRAEYNNTIRDLVGIPITPADNFPSDDVGNGFDNMGDVLSVSPLLMEKYLLAAEQVSSAALFGAQSQKPANRQFEAAGLMPRGSARRGRRLFDEPYFYLAEAGSVAVEFAAPRAGDYVVRAFACARQAGAHPVQMSISVDGRKCKVVVVNGELATAEYAVRIPLTTGRHRLSASFVNYQAEPPPPPLPEPRERKRRGARRESRQVEARRILIVRRFEVEGPFSDETRVVNRQAAAEARRRILFCQPGKNRSISDCANAILTRFASRAFRRPLGQGEIKPYVDLVEVTAKHEPFDRAIQAGLTAILVSHDFLFRLEGQGTTQESQIAVPITGFELASRLSYFLWSSMPDDELFRVAADGSLARTEILDAQVRRMLRDRKSRGLVDNFAVQWLNLNQLDLANPDPAKFERFDEDLRSAMRRETELFFESLIRDDRSILDLLHGRYTFVNQRLAEHYAIAGIRGPEFREVSLAGQPRAGVLTHASILTLTSQRSRTSPVKRGKWIMETFLGSAPPPPPPNIPELSEVAKDNPHATLREQLELHRKNVSCASCHKVMDPLGLGLENFDGIGHWRETEQGRAIDATGTLPGGDSFQGPIELIGVLAKRDETFRRHFVRTLLTYALGRGLEYYDGCAVDRVVEGTRRAQDRLSALVIAIVHTDPFLMRRGGGVRHEP